MTEEQIEAVAGRVVEILRAERESTVRAAAWGVIAQAESLLIEARALAGHLDALKAALD